MFGTKKRGGEERTHANLESGGRKEGEPGKQLNLLVQDLGKKLGQGVKSRRDS